MQYPVSVRELCDFTAKAGDLDLRFTPSPTAREGVAGHQLLAQRRHAGYESEISLQGEFEELRVRGRADGFDPDGALLEEFKTYRGDLARVPQNRRNRHWAQARIYGWLLCSKLGLERLRIALVYFDVDRQTETALVEEHEAVALRDFFVAHCTAFLAWARLELAHRAARDATLRALGFPFAALHDGQRQLAEGVYRAAGRGATLLAQAPTGVGKTLGTLFPLMKAMPEQRLDKIFFLTAKTSGRRMALDAIGQLAAGSAGRAPLRTLELVAREKSCEYPGRACHGDACPLARGFYDRLPAARNAALAENVWDHATLRRVAAAHTVCPYYLAQELVNWADAVVGDYNHYFDSSALLHAAAVANEWRVGLLVDEAHNLVGRAREMYSGTLRTADVETAWRTAPSTLRPALQQVRDAWQSLPALAGTAPKIGTEMPRELLAALQEAAGALSRHFTEHPDASASPLLQFFFDALRWCRLGEAFDADSVIERSAGHDASISVRNVLPANFLAPRFAAAATCTLFSATLQPGEFQRDLLGLPAATRWLDVESPFRPEQLEVNVHRLSTRWRDRARTLGALAGLMAARYASRPGNYLAFFSSYDYLERCAALVREQHPEVPLWTQRRNMSERERSEFMERFTPEGRGIGFAVLGGAFAEGIDLPGERLVGAFVVTLGLPQVTPLNEALQERLSARFGCGAAYTYLYPGLQRVVQAAGRIIRSTSDRGVLDLVDDRFAQPEIRACLPRWWGLSPSAEAQP